MSKPYQAFLEDPQRTLIVEVDWGNKGIMTEDLNNQALYTQTNQEPEYSSASPTSLLSSSSPSTPSTIQLELTIHGLARRPGYKLIARRTRTVKIDNHAEKCFEGQDEEDLFGVSWSTLTCTPISQEQRTNDSLIMTESQHNLKMSCNALDREQANNKHNIRFPEFLAQLHIWKVDNNDKLNNEDIDETSVPVLLLRRCRHILPPPEPHFFYRVCDVLSAPSLPWLQGDDENEIRNLLETQTPSSSTMTIRSFLEQPFYDKHFRPCANNDDDRHLDQTQQHENDSCRRIRRRGFGIELETVQLPPQDPERTGCFTISQEYHRAVKRACDLLERQEKLKNIETDSSEEPTPQSKQQLEQAPNHVVSSNTCTSSSIISRIRERLLLWTVETDPEVENAAPASRIELLKKLTADIMTRQQKKTVATAREEEQAALSLIPDNVRALILGGKPSVKDYYSYSTEQGKVENSTTATQTAANESQENNSYFQLPEYWENLNQASPEYKSPSPPMELYHEFPPPSMGFDDADVEVHMFLDAVLKQKQLVKPATENHRRAGYEHDDHDDDDGSNAKSILCPTVSMIGQSASSFHVHVNVSNPKAWPRREPLSPLQPPYDSRKEAMMEEDLAATHALMSVLINWVRFDSVVAMFCQPWMKRDRSFAPLYAWGPEFMFDERTWLQGTTGLHRENDKQLCSFPRFFRHMFDTYQKGVADRKRLFSYTRDMGGKGTVHDESDTDHSLTATDELQPLFDQVFDPTVIQKTLYRRNSLNLCSLHKYGTVEFRRMHATLDARFVNAWTWFCVGFVEKFSQPAEYEKVIQRHFSFSSNNTMDQNGEDCWRKSLELLYQAQNEATLEDLMELLTSDPIKQDDEEIDKDAGPMVPPSTFEILLSAVQWDSSTAEVTNGQ